MAATPPGAVVVPIYQTNSPEECHWVISDSGACAIVCEDVEQLAKIAAIRDQLPQLRTVIVIDPPPSGSSNGNSAAAQRSRRSRSRRCASAGASRSPEELEARRAAVRPEDPFTFIYTSGTTGPPKGCVLTHGNYRAIIDMVCEAGEISGDEVTTCTCRWPTPSPCSMQLAAFDLGSTLAYFGGDTKQIVAELLGGQADLPAVGAARLREDLHARSGRDRGAAAEEQERWPRTIQLGMKVRDLISRGEPVPEELQEPFEEADERLFKNVRAIFGGRVRHATSGAAPIAHEILEFFWACGVPVLEGYGMTETATAATDLDGREPPLRQRRARASRAWS